MGGRVKKSRFLRKYIGLISIAFILALSAVGIGYGAWNDELQMEMTVSTGEFDPVVDKNTVNVQWSIWFLGWTPWADMSSNYVEVNKVGNNICIDVDETISLGDLVRYKVSFTVKNNGTIPIKYVIDEDYLEETNIDIVDVSPIDKGHDDDWIKLSARDDNSNNYNSNNYIVIDKQGAFATSTFKVKLKTKQWNM